MADVYQKVVEILDNSAYIAALKKAEQEVQLLTALQTAGGTAAVKALRETERAQQQQAKEAAKAAAAEMAAEQKKAEYLERLRLQSYKDEQKAAERAEREAKRAAAGPSAWTLALQANTKALGEQQGAINKAREATGLLGAAVSAVSPQIGGLLGGLQKAEGVFSATAAGAQVLGSSLITVSAAAGPVLAVAGTLAYAWEKHKERQEAAAEQTKNYTEALGELRDAMATLARQQVELNERAGLLTGEYSAQEVAFDKARRSALDSTKAQREATEEQLAALIAEGKVIKYNQENWAKTGLLFRASAKELAGQAETNAARVRTLEDQLKALDATATEVAVTTVKVTEGEEKLKDATEKRTKATKDGTTALKEQKDALQELLFIQGVDEQIAKLGDFFETERAGLEQNAALYVKYRTDLEAAGDARELAQTRAVDEQTRINNELAQGQAAALDFAATLSNEVSGALSDVADTMEKSNKRGAKAARAASVATGILSTSISALEAGASTVAALSSNPVTLPFALPAGVAMTAAVEGAYVAKVAAQKSEASFTDTPGPVRMGAAMGTSANFAANDTVVAARSPDSMLRQVLDAVRERPGPAPEIRSTRREPLGMRMAREPAILDLTSSLGRVTRGRING